MTAENFLDFHDILVNDVAGTPAIFLFLGAIAVFIICAQFRFPNSVTFFAIALFFAFMSFFYTLALAPLIITIAGFVAWQVWKVTRG
jgi:hypothetical protein